MEYLLIEFWKMVMRLMFSPHVGQTSTSVTIRGRNLLMGGAVLANVTLGGNEVQTVVHANDTTVVVVAASGTAGLAGVYLEADTGAFVRNASLWEYVPAGTIQSIEPNNGRVGSVVTIRGSNLLGGATSLASVTFGGVEVESVGSFNATTVVATVGLSMTPGVVDVTIVADTGAVVASAAAWAYLEAGNITSVSPASGTEGTTVTIEGSHLLGGGAFVQRVLLGPAAAAVTFSNDTRVVAVAGGQATASGPWDVTVVADTGARALTSNAWRYIAPGAIDAVVPSSGQRGTVVTVNGTGLLSGADALASITLGNSSATIVSFTDDEVVFVAPAAIGPQAVDVALRAASGPVVSASAGFQYLAAGVVTEVEPSSGIFGTRVTITGTGLLNGGQEVAAFTIDGVATQEIVLSGATQEDTLRRCLQ